MKRFITALLLACITISPVVAHAGNNNARAECIFSFGFAKKSCKRGWSAEETRRLFVEAGQLFSIAFTQQKDYWTKKSSYAKAKDITLEIMPNELRFNVEFLGSGFDVHWKTQEKVKRVVDLARKDKLDLNVMWDVLPDNLRIRIGGEFALVMTVRAGTTFVYDVEEDIKHIVKVIKEHVE